MLYLPLQQNNMKLALVCSYGRSGSTFLMGLLKDLGVYVEGGLPFEDRTSQASFISWLASALESKSSPEMHEGEQYWQFFRGVGYKARYAVRGRQMKEIEEDYSGYLSDVRGKSATLAEKCVGVELLRYMIAADLTSCLKPIYLLRDPRDIFLSVKAFNKKRGNISFGDGDDNMKMLSGICDFTATQLRDAKRNGGLVCRYELLARKDQKTVRELLQFLDITSISAESACGFIGAKSDDKAVAGHMTAGSLENSMGRWKGADGEGYRDIFKSVEARLAKLGF